jgi:cellulose synthase operon protein YhjQ
METGENKNGVTPEPEDLAKDIARLYSLANVEDLPYYSFPKRRHGPHPAQLSELSQSEPDAIHPSAPERSSVAVEPPAITADTPAFPAPETARSSVPVESAPTPAEATSQRAPLADEDEPEVISPWERLRAKIQTGQAPPKPAPAPPRDLENLSVAAAVFSLAGGVGKTTITANLGRILCAIGEQVLLVDTSSSGLLPFYFGASDLRPGLRTFMAPNATYPPMHVIGAEEVTAEWLERDVKPAMRMAQRTIFDLGASSMAMLPQVLAMCDVLLVPILSDLNSILTVPRIERLIAGIREKGINAPLPFYIFNKFDEHSSMDQEARNLVSRQCGDRLLPNTIRRSPEVTAAISERMTVADHSPDSEVTQDVLRVALWLRKMLPLRRTAKPQTRWSEQ